MINIFEIETFMSNFNVVYIVGLFVNALFAFSSSRSGTPGKLTASISLYGVKGFVYGSLGSGVD